MKSLYRFFHKSPARTLLFAMIWTGLILFACLIPGRDVPEVDLPLIDKWVHFILFGTFAFLWLCTLKQINTKRAVMVFLAAVLLGYIVELLQGSGITAGRSYDLFDVLADGIGGALGTFVFLLLYRLYGKERA